jgi:hypothetical protein
MTDALTDHTSPAPRTWRTLTDAEWDIVRRDYLAGVSARDLCDRYEIGLSTLRLKARQGGWRRVDRPADVELFPDGGPSEASGVEDAAAPYDSVAADVEDWSDMAVGARLRLRRAIQAGRPAEAASWMRLHERLSARAVAAAEADEGEPSAEVASPAPDRTEAVVDGAPPADPPPARPDHLDDVLDKARRVEALVHKTVRAARTGDRVAMAEIDAAVTSLKANSPASRPERPDEGLVMGAAWAELDEVLDSLDALDPVFSAAPPAAPPADAEVGAERERLHTLRRRRLDLGLGVADLDDALQALDAGRAAVSP